MQLTIFSFCFKPILFCYVIYYFIQPSFSYITWIEARYPLAGNPSPPGSPWPLPHDYNPENTLLTLDPGNFEFTTQSKCDILVHAFKRYRPYVFFDTESGKFDSKLQKISKLEVKVTKSDCKYPKLEEDESYELSVSAGTSKLSSVTVWGALRGLETFSQLVYQDVKTKAYHMNVTAIKDKPTFSYRGLLVDTARHFQPMKVLKQNLDAMAFNKFNVFHWHIVDDQSFPFESKLYPNLTEMGAYSPKHVYKQSDMKEIIEYARLRGIRVIPEIDTPGHTKGFGKAFPDLITSCYGKGPSFPNTANYTEHSEREILDPIKENTYTFFKEFFKEVKGIFPDDYIHLGMDEVYYGCWESSPIIKKFMADKGFTKIKDVEQYYAEKTVKNVKEIGYKYMSWQDPVDNGVKMDAESIIQIWKDKSLDIKLGYWHDYIRAIAKQNYKMVVSACWYLNYISYGMDWKKYYECDPRGFEGTDKEKALVIGGEACMWGEYVDATNLIARIWPRASAVGERLWSSQSLNNTDDAQYRLDEQRCRMMRRGLPTQPILNGFCGDYDWDLVIKESKNAADNVAKSTINVILTNLAIIIYTKLR